LPRQPGLVNAGPFAKIRYPRLIFRFLATGVGSVEGLGAHPIPAFEGKQIFLQGVDVGQWLVSMLNELYGRSEHWGQSMQRYEHFV
jgi:hypothetical protein